MILPANWMLKKPILLTRPTQTAIGPSLPEAAKLASLPMDVPFPMRRSQEP